MLDISVVIPFKDKAEMTLACLRSLQEYGEPLKEILLISNNSSAGELSKVEEAAAAYDNTRVLEHNVPFNFQAINNWAITKSTGKVAMMLNNDIELTTESHGLLSYMYERALEAKVGAVGCVLLYEDRKTIQHAGVYLVAGGTADHLYIGQPLAQVVSKIEADKNCPDITRDLRVTAVTAAAVMIERRKFEKITGLNEAFIIGGGDVDLCLRLEEAGYHSVLAGSKHGTMVHKESKSRSMLTIPYVDFVESYKSYSRHFDVTKGDPYISQEALNHAK
jgi:GT2 family glycosyltransferase